MRENGYCFGCMKPLDHEGRCPACGFDRQKLHENGMVHQDISPDNIMINTSGKGTLIDFGTVWSASELSDKEERAIYKRSYSAYEQLEKHGQRGPWTDVYGLCATIYYMLTGEKPFDATERIYEDTLQGLSRMGVTLDDEVEKLIMRGLVVESAERLQSVEELYQALYHDSLIAFPVMTQQETKESSFRWSGRRGRSCTLTSQMERELDRMDARRRRSSAVGLCRDRISFLWCSMWRLVIIWRCRKQRRNILRRMPDSFLWIWHRRY